MSWSAPSSRTTGTIITATIWNQDVVDNSIALRAGGIAIASQAALDLIGASSSSQLARIANTTVNGYILIGTTGALPTWGTGPLARYTATKVDVVSSAVGGALTTTVSFTIPANAMSDGDAIDVIIASLEKNNSGVSDTVLFGFTAGAGSNVTLETTGWADSGTERQNTRRLTLVRVGGSLYGFLVASRTNGLSAIPSFVCLSSTPTNFTSDFTLAITVDFTGSDASLYFKPQAAKVLHYKG